MPAPTGFSGRLAALFRSRRLSPADFLRLRRLLAARVWLAGVILAVFLVIVAWTNPSAHGSSEQISAAHPASSAVQAVDYLKQSPAKATPTPTQRFVLPTFTPIPTIYYDTGRQTTGIILASTVLVMIVVFGVLSFLPRKEE